MVILNFVLDNVEKIQSYLELFSLHLTTLLNNTKIDINWIYSLFNSREKATFFWFGVISLVFLYNDAKNKRGKVSINLFKAFFNKFLISILLGIFLYSYVTIMPIVASPYWENSLIKDWIIFNVLIFFLIIKIFSKRRNQGENIKQELIQGFISVNLLSFYMDLYPFSFIFEVIISFLLTFGFIGVEIVKLNKNLEKKEKEKQIKLLTGFNSVLIFSLLIGTVFNVVDNPSKIFDYKEYYPTVFNLYLAVTCIPGLYLFTFFSGLNQMTQTMKFSNQKCPNLSWKWIVIYKTKLKLSLLEVFSRIPYEERMMVENSKDFKSLLDKHFANKNIYPISHCVKKIIVDYDCLSILINDSLLKKEKLEHENFIVPYEIYIRYSFLNNKNGLKVLKKTTEPLSFDKIKILSPFDDNFNKVQGNETYLTSSDIEEWKKLSKKEYKDFTYKKWLYFQNLDLILSNLNKNVLESVTINSNSAISFEQCEKALKNSSINKHIAKGVLSIWKKNIKKYTPSQVNFEVRRYNFISGIANKSQNNSYIDTFQLNPLYKEIVLSSIVYGNAIVSGDKLFCEQMVKIVEYLNIDIDVMYFNKSKNRVEYINGKR